jgi:hypothetical protein
VKKDKRIERDYDQEEAGFENQNGGREEKPPGPVDMDISD